LRASVTSGQALAVALEALDLRAADHRHAVALQDPAHPRADLQAEDTLQRLVLQQDDRAALAERRQRGRDLAADEGAADAHDVLDAVDVAEQRVRVAQRAQVVDALQP
jgi:hypothetical protein